MESHEVGSAWRDPRYRNPWLTNPYAEGRSRAIVFGAAVLGVVGVGLPVLNEFVDVSPDVVGRSAGVLTGSSSGPDSPSPATPATPLAAPPPPAATVEAVDRAVQNTAAQSSDITWSSGVAVQPVVMAPPTPAPPLSEGPAQNPSPAPPPSGQTPPPSSEQPPPSSEEPPPSSEEPPPSSEEPPSSSEEPPPSSESPLPSEGQQEFDEEMAAANQEIADEVPAMTMIPGG